MPIPLGVLAVAGAGGGGGAAGNAYEHLETVLLTGTQKTITFNNITTYASTYEHLQIRASIRSSRAALNDYIRLYFNGNTGYTNTRMHYLIGGGGVVQSATDTIPAIYQIEAANATANAFSALIIDILDPHNTNKNTTARILVGSLPQETIGLYSIGWFDTSAITDINLRMNSADFVAKSRISLYGMRSS